MAYESAVFALFLCVIISNSNVAAERFARIKGGTEANIAEFPWIASIRHKGAHFCGGAIINPKTILTAAHCVFDRMPQRLDVRVSSKYRSSGGQILAVDSITIHGQFDRRTNDYDLAALRLSAPIVFSSTAKAVALAKPGSKLSAGDHAYIVGWGRINPKTSSQPQALQSLRVVVQRDKLCQTLLRIVLTERMMCAGARDSHKVTCPGDSGGPLTVGGVLVGIASYGPPCTGPDIYTKVAVIRPWVEEYLQKYHEVLK